MKLLPGIVALLLVLGGCAGGGASDPGVVEVTNIRYLSLNGMRYHLRCGVATITATPHRYAEFTQACVGADGIGRVTGNVFADNVQRDKYLAARRQEGELSVMGWRWVIDCRTRAQQRKIAAIIKAIKPASE